MSKGGSAPSPPMFISPPPYTPPPMFQAPPDPNTIVPQVSTPTQVINQGNAIEGFAQNGQLPSFLQLSSSGPNSDLVNAAADNFWQQNILPQLASAQSQLYNNGQNYGSYGGALLGQLLAQGQLSKFQAGLQQAQQNYNNLLSGRQSYFAGGPTVAATQNENSVQRGLGVASLQSQNAGMLNNYNLAGNQGQNSYGLSATGMANNFNQGNYGNQLQAYELNQQNAANQNFGLGALGLGAANLIGGGIGSMFGGVTPSFGTGSNSSGGLLGPISAATGGLGGGFLNYGGGGGLPSLGLGNPYTASAGSTGGISFQ